MRGRFQQIAKRVDQMFEQVEQTRRQACPRCHGGRIVRFFDMFTATERAATERAIEDLRASEERGDRCDCGTPLAYHIVRLIPAYMAGTNLAGGCSNCCDVFAADGG